MRGMIKESGNLMSQTLHQGISSLYLSNFEIIKDLSKLNEIKNYVVGKNITAIIGKSTPQQSDESITELFEFLKSNSNTKILNTYTKGNTYGAFQTLENIKGTKDFVVLLLIFMCLGLKRTIMHLHVCRCTFKFLGSSV